MRYLALAVSVLGLLTVQGCRRPNPNFNGDLAGMNQDILAIPTDMVDQQVDMTPTVARDLSSDLEDMLVSHDMKHHHDMTQVDQSSIPDLAARMCVVGVCTAPNCGGACCKSGEWCDSGSCKCGNGPACTLGEVCASGIPVPGGPQCGTVCCGGGHPCPH